MDTAFWYKLTMTGALIILSIISFWSMLGFRKVRPGNILFGVELPVSRLDSEEAQAVGEQYKRESIMLLGALIIVCVLFWLIPISSENLFLAFIIIAIVACFSIYIPFLIANRRLRAVKIAKRWYAVSEAEDSDRHWRGGIIYYNRYDPSTRVPSRMNPKKKTFNLASRRGRSFAIILLVIVVVLIWYVVVSMDYENSAIPALIIHPDGVIEVDSTYGQEFHVSDIVEVSLVDDIPVKMRIMGTSTAKFRRGTFEVEGCPKSTLYVFNDAPPYIKIKLKDKYIFFNYLSAMPTENLYRQLLDAMSEAAAAA